MQNSKLKILWQDSLKTSKKKVSKSKKEIFLKPGKNKVKLPKNRLLCPKNLGCISRSQWNSAQMNNRHPWPLKKSKSCMGVVLELLGL